MSVANALRIVWRFRRELPKLNLRSGELRLFDLDGRFAQWRSVRSFRIGETFAFVIADDNALRIFAHDIVRINRYFAASSGRVDDVLRDGITSGMAAQRFHDLET